jgi:hypothetical protein
MKTTERWTTAQVAEWCNIRPSTYRDYVSEGRAPGPLPERDLKTGAKLYDAEAVKTWHANRPGPGARTDLGQPGADLGADPDLTAPDRT